MQTPLEQMEAKGSSMPSHAWCDAMEGAFNEVMQGESQG